MGANQGRAKGNKQEAEYEEPGKKTWETRSERTGRAKEARAERAHRRRPAVRGNGKKEERKKQRPSSQKRKGSD